MKKQTLIETAQELLFQSDDRKKNQKKINSFELYVGAQLDQVETFQRQTAKKLISVSCIEKTAESQKFLLFHDLRPAIFLYAASLFIPYNSCISPTSSLSDISSILLSVVTIPTTHSAMTISILSNIATGLSASTIPHIKFSHSCYHCHRPNNIFRHHQKTYRVCITGITTSSKQFAIYLNPKTVSG